MSIEICWKRDGDCVRLWEQSSENVCLVTVDLRHAEVLIRGEKYEIEFPEITPEARACFADHAIRLTLKGDVRCSVIFSPRDGDGIYVRGRLCGPNAYRDAWRQDVQFLEYCGGRKRADIRNDRITLVNETEIGTEALEIATAYILLKHG